jgi:murein L,D-transpeptidase YafK
LLKGRVFKDDEALTLWVTDDENKIPLLVESDIFVGSIKAEITKIKGNRNPLTAKIK